MNPRNALHLLSLLRILTFFSLICLSSELYSYSIVGKDLVDLIPEESIVKLYQRWKEKHQTDYNHEEEAQKRLENFRKNLFYVIEKNANRKSHSEHQVGLNKFADLSNDEFRKQFLSNKQRRLPESYGPRNSGTCYAPPSLYWRKKGIATSTYKDRRDCGSPWGLSSIEVLEWINALINGELIGFLEQELSTDCSRTEYAYDEVNTEESFEWVVSKSGTDLPGYMGRNDASSLIKMKPEFVGDDGVEKTSGGLICAVVHRPICVCMDASAMDLQLYTGGIYDGECSNNPQDVNHDVLIVGYDSEDGKDYWIVKNSWGNDWGVGGFLYVRRSSFSAFRYCGINSMISEHLTEQDSPHPPDQESQPPPTQLDIPHPTPISEFDTPTPPPSEFETPPPPSVPPLTPELETPPPSEFESPPPPSLLPPTPELEAPPPPSEIEKPPPPTQFETPPPSLPSPTPELETPPPPSEFETPPPPSLPTPTPELETPPPPSEFETPPPPFSPPPTPELETPPPPSEFETPPPPSLPPPTPELQTPPPPSEIEMPPPPTQFETPPPSLPPPPPPPSEFETPPPPTPELETPPPPSEFETPPPPSFPPPTPSKFETPPPPCLPPPTPTLETPPPPSIFETPPPPSFPPPTPELETPPPPSEIKTPPPPALPPPTPEIETPPPPSEFETPPPPSEIEVPPPPSTFEPPPPLFSPPPPSELMTPPPPPTIVTPPPLSTPPPPPTPSLSPPFTSPPPPTPTLPPPSTSPPLSPPIATPPPPLTPPPPPTLPPPPSFTPPTPSISPPVTPLSPPPAPPIPPFSPPPPRECGEVAGCSSAESCCCYMGIYDVCLIYGCCPFNNAICCAGAKLCCPSDYPVCDVKEKRCLKNKGDVVGLGAGKIHIATYKFPWTTSDKLRQKYQHISWKLSRLAAMR